MEGGAINLENNGNCLFCKVPPAPLNPVTFYSVRTLLEYLQINQVEVEVKAEGEEQEAQFITVDLNGSEVNAGLCKGCGDLAKRFLELKAMMEMSMEACLVSIQMKMEVGSEVMEYPAREGIIMKMALQNLNRTKPRLFSQNLQVSETASAPANEPLAVVKIGEEEDEVETTQHSDSVPVICKHGMVECSVPPDEYHDNQEADERNKRRIVADKGYDKEQRVLRSLSRRAINAARKNKKSELDMEVKKTKMGRPSKVVPFLLETIDSNGLKLYWCTKGECNHHHKIKSNMKVHYSNCTGKPFVIRHVEWHACKFSCGHTVPPNRGNNMKRHEKKCKKNPNNIK